MPLVSFHDLDFTLVSKNEKPWIRVTVKNQIESSKDALDLRGRYFVCRYIDTVLVWLKNNGCISEPGLHERLRTYARKERERAAQDKLKTAARLVVTTYR